MLELLRPSRRTATWVWDEETKGKGSSVSTNGPALTVEQGLGLPASMEANGVRVLEDPREAGRASPRSLCSHTRVTSNDVQPIRKGWLGKDGGQQDWKRLGSKRL